MKSALLATVSAALFVAESICAEPPVNVRSALLAAAKRDNPEFPNGKGILLTHFSHVGELTTARGELIYVADRRAVIGGMLAPRGLNYICFFDAQFRYLGKVKYVSSRPLWCEGSKVFLFGDLDNSSDPEGNVMDLTEGFSALRIYHASVYGSSGGIRD